MPVKQLCQHHKKVTDLSEELKLLEDVTNSKEVVIKAIVEIIRTREHKLPKMEFKKKLKSQNSLL